MTKEVVKPQVNEEEVKKLWQSIANEPYIKEGIDTLTIDEKGKKLQVRFRDGHRLEYKHQHFKEISLVEEGIQSILRHINLAKEKDFLLVEEKNE